MALQFDIGMVKDTYARWSADQAMTLAAALAFSTIFAIAPLFIVVIAIAGTVMGFGHTTHPHTHAENVLVGAVAHSAGKGAAATVRQMVAASFGKPGQTLIAQIVGWVTFILGASGLFMALQNALNIVWHVQPEKTGLWLTIRNRIASVGMLLAIGFLLLVTTAINLAISFVSAHTAQALPFPGAGIVFAVINWAVSVAVITLLFALMYKYLPDAEVAWRDVWTGALATAILFVIGQALIALYMGRAGVASSYGAAGSLLAILLWVYYSAMILLFGAEFTRVYAEKRGSRIGAYGSATAAPAPST